MDSTLASLPIYKYPRTPHLEGSRLQQGDDASDQTPLASLKGRRVVIEEKVDGANSGISFSDGGDLLLQSRGHYLMGGWGERQFNWMKPWAQHLSEQLMSVLDDRYVAYGEALHAKHSVPYDMLPHLWLEFDVLDRRSGKFLSTQRRRELLRDVPILGVPVLYEGPMPTDPRLLWKLVHESLAKSDNWRAGFEQAVRREGLDVERAWKETFKGDTSEGLYIKIENDEFVEARYKLVHPGFVQTIIEAESHHAARPVIPNGLAAGVDLYAHDLTMTWEDLGLRTMRSLEELKDFDAARWQGNRIERMTRVAAEKSRGLSATGHDRNRG